MNTLIHSTAVIHPNAQLHPTVQVGAYAVIGENVTIGAGSTVGHHAVLEGPMEIGMNNRIFPSAALGLEPQDLKYKGGASWVKIGDNNLIREFVTINRATAEGEATVIGNNNMLMTYVHVAHNCVIEDEVIITNSVGLAGHVHIESQVRIGGIVGIHQFVHIGRMAMVGGMSRITKDIPPYMLVEGNPARVRSLNLVGLKRSGLSSEELSNLKKAFRLLYHSDSLPTEAIKQLSSLPQNPQLQHLQKFMEASISQSGRRGLIPGKKG